LQSCLPAAEGVDAAPVLEGLIAQSRPAHGTLATPIRAAAAFVGASPGSDASGAGSSNSGSGGGSGVTLIVRAVTDEQAQVSCLDCQVKRSVPLPARRMPPARSCDCLVPTGLLPFCLLPARCRTLHAQQFEDPACLSLPLHRCWWSRLRGGRSCSAAMWRPSCLTRSSQVRLCGVLHCMHWSWALLLPLSCCSVAHCVPVWRCPLAGCSSATRHLTMSSRLRRVQCTHRPLPAL